MPSFRLEAGSKDKLTTLASCAHALETDRYLMKWIAVEVDCYLAGVSLSVALYSLQAEVEPCFAD